MFTFVPAQLQKPRALVVVLHGCGQTAAGYDLGAGWSTLAKHYGFALLMPEQQRVNNANSCFNWFNPEDTAREQRRGRLDPADDRAHGRAITASIRSRVFITGLSAGGAMTSVMLATYPEVFAAGAVIAGLPYGIATQCARGAERHVPFAARAGRANSAISCAMPRIIAGRGRNCRCGTAAPTAPSIPATPTRSSSSGSTCMICRPRRCRKAMVDGYPRQVWWNADGETVVESYTITDMAHGTPLGLADNDQRYGAQGAFLIEAGISSSYHIAKFFGLTDWIPDASRRRRPGNWRASKPALSPAPHLARSMPRRPSPKMPAEPKREAARGSISARSSRAHSPPRD